MSPTTSFIPRRVLPTAGKGPPKYKKSADLLIIGSALIFLLVVGAAAGLFFYQRYLTQQTEDLTSTLKRVEGRFEAPLINELVRLSKVIGSLKELLDDHRSPARVFGVLESLTIPQVRFLDFSLASEDGVMQMEGESLSYTALAQQVLLLDEENFIEGIQLSDISLSDTGTVSFSIRANLNPDLLIYQP